MVTVGLMIRVETRADKAAEFEARLHQVVDVVRAEGKAVVWFGLRVGPTSFVIFDAFAGDEDRQAHLDANFESLRAAGKGLFTGPPAVERVDVVAGLLPGA